MSRYLLAAYVVLFFFTAGFANVPVIYRNTISEEAFRDTWGDSTGPKKTDVLGGADPRFYEAIFCENWDNDELFVYGKLSVEQLPDEIPIELLADGGRFSLTWYGRLNSPYGARWGRLHRGIDLHLTTGDTVVSAFGGVVRYARFNKGGYGNCIVIRHLNGLETLYGHLSSIVVEENQYVQSGQMIGRGGSTGKSDGPHLHFETRYKDFSFDPLLFYDLQRQQLTVQQLVLKKQDLDAVGYEVEDHGKGKQKGSSSKKIFYTVKKGDSLQRIAKRFGVTVKKISQLNGIRKSSTIRPGKKLRIK